MLVFIFSTSLYSSGNQNNYELGTAIYRQLISLSEYASGSHWHGGVYLYFEYVSNYGHMRYPENNGYFDQLHVKKKSELIGIDISKISTLKTDFKNKFRKGPNYYGAYSVDFNLQDNIASTLSIVMGICDWNDNHSQNNWQYMD